MVVVVITAAVAVVAACVAAACVRVRVWVCPLNRACEQTRGGGGGGVCVCDMYSNVSLIDRAREAARDRATHSIACALSKAVWAAAVAAAAFVLFFCCCCCFLNRSSP